ncbi:dihydrolipoyl dehydrogenase [Candidatus Micrarchaeota archaeon]|nr:dihydrolipoyl dehydrogenase [Candidatus Micrarchaeota archaeon]
MVMGQLTTKADVAVIGAGPGGYTAAIRLAQLGKEVVLIEKDKLGGTCTNVGCIPSKALIHAADLRYAAMNGKAMGVEANVFVNFAKTQAWKDSVVRGLRDGITSLCKMNGVDVIDGRAFFTSSNALTVETEAGMRTIEFKKAVIATGTVIKGLPNLRYDHKRIIDSDDALSLREIPKRMIVVGGGYIAAEMACMFLKLGSKVTVIYRGERLLKTIEPELSDALLRGMRKLGGEVLFNSEVVKIEGENAVVKTPQGEKRIGFDRMLVAAGRVPYLEGLGLEKTKVKLDKEGLVAVDATMKTTDDSIYAIGDVTPGPQLAHKAFRQGKVAAECIAGLKSAFDNQAMPMVVFAEPVLATVGLTEEEARKKGYKIRVGRMPFTTSGRANAMNASEGFVKIIANENGVILGVHMAGAGADALIAEAAFAIEMGATLEDLAATIHAHPTMSESVMETAEDAMGKAIHLYRKK